MACVGLVPRPMPEPGLENAGVVGRAGAPAPGTMPRRRASTGYSYSGLRPGVEPAVPRILRCRRGFE